jgi:hypothetical protein
VALSPDGARLTTASRDNSARLWDASTGQPMGPPMWHDWSVAAIAFSPDGTKIATASGDKTARLWDAASGRPLGSSMKHDGSVLAVVFSPDGTKIATASEDNTARLWRVPRSLPDDAAWIATYVETAAGLEEDTGGTLRPISADAAAVAWTKIGKSPAWLEYRRSMLEESRQAWHEEEAAHWEAAGNGFAAAFHLKWLLDRNPQDSELRSRLNALRKQKPGMERQ